MLSVQPNTLSDEELERLSYMQAGALPAEWAEVLRKNFAREFEKSERVDDPRQLSLFDTK
jgi:hypothetical protein